MNIDDLKIRFANNYDFDVLKKLSYDKTLIYVNNPDEWLENTIERNRILVAEIKEEICGMITWDYIFQDTVPLMTWIYVVKEYRHTKITRLLINSICEHLKTLGYKRLLYSMHESVKDPSTIKPHGFLEWPGKGTENIYWMKLA